MSLTTLPLRPDFWQDYRAAVIDYQTNPCDERRQAFIATYRAWAIYFSPATADDLVAQLHQRFAL